MPSPARDPEAKNLVLVTHPRKQDWRDFEAIGREVARLAPDIFVYIVSPLDTPDSVDDWKRRSLTVSFGALGAFEPRRGRIFQSAFIPKHEEYRLFTAGGVPMPFTSVFRSDQPFEFSRHKLLVVAKPTKMGTMSHGDKVFLMRRERVQRVVPARFSPELTADQAPVIVQDFIHPGPKARVFRVLLLFGEPLFCYRVTAGETPPLDAADSELESARVASNVPGRTIDITADEEVIAFAKRASRAMWWIPLQGMDIIRETGTGALYVLESNPGGNTWAFSSQVGAETRALTGGADPLKRQFGAWSIAAKALVEATRSYAE
jgi:hypothetical protein